MENVGKSKKYTKMRWTQPAPTVQRTYGADKSVRGLKCLCLRSHLTVWHIFCLPVFILCWRQKTFQPVHLRPCRCKSLGLLPPLQITGGSGKLYFRPIFGSLQWKCSGPCCVLMITYVCHFPTCFGKIWKCKGWVSHPARVKSDDGGRPMVAGVTTPLLRMMEIL